MKGSILRAAVACALAFTALVVSAQPAGPGSAPPGQQGEGRPHGPPPEALQACKNLKSGDACGFTGPMGKMTGSCWAPEQRPLACRPKGAPPPPPLRGASAPK